MVVSRLEGDFQHTGTHSFGGTVNLPPGTVKDADVNADADLAYSKLQHLHHVSYSQADGAAIADDNAIIFIARAPCTIVGVTTAIGDTAATGDSTVDIDALTSTSGGAFASILTAAEQLDSSTAVRTVVTATISGTQTMTTGDLLKITVDATVGTGSLPEGLVVNVYVAEKGQ